MTIDILDLMSKRDFAVSSPAPWMDVFALPEKSNMAVTESDHDPKAEKCPSFSLCDL